MIDGFGETAERLRRSTVLVEDRGGRLGAGSGVIWGPDVVVTNAHVARGSQPTVKFWDGSEAPARVVKRDPRRDIASLQVAVRGPAAETGDSSTVRPGELVLAIGNPLGFMGALTTGVVHAVGPVSGIGPREWIQAAIRLAPGNSGGPLADVRGRLIGINTMVVAGGLGLAIPSNTVLAFLARSGSPGWLGVTVRPVPLQFDGRDRVGLLLLEVAPGGPAEFAALLPGDILMAVDGRPFASPEDLQDALESSAGRVRLQFLRGDRTTVRNVTVIVHEARAEAA